MTPEDACKFTDYICRLAPVIPVLVIEDATIAEPLAEALVSGGLPTLEVTLRSAAALDAIKTMSKVAGAVYLQDTFISLQALSTPFFATDQKGSLACPCETTIISIAKTDTDIMAQLNIAIIVKYIFFILIPPFIDLNII